jgi:catechol 2,3-dioxygenase-like lactoylglutathione lyase family enzyme
MDTRPAVWIGHVVLAVADPEASADFWRGLGMREVERNPEVVVLELRGGTHLLLLPGDPEAGAGVPFDLMVDDLDATHRRWADRGLEPSAIEHRQFHTSFTVRDPNGYVVTIYSSHVVGEV